MHEGFGDSVVGAIDDVDDDEEEMRLQGFAHGRRERGKRLFFKSCFGGCNGFWSIADEDLITDNYNGTLEECVFFEDVMSIILLGEFLFMQAESTIFKGCAGE